MGAATTHAFGTAMAIAAAAFLLIPPPAAQPGEPPAHPAGLDLGPFLDLGEFYVKPVPPEKDPRTGFIVGGKNDTALIRKLPALGGRTIAELERDMRPGAESEVGSEDGFLGRDEKLLDVLAADNRTGTPYRVDPRRVVEVFDFLTPKGKGR